MAADIVTQVGKNAVAEKLGGLGSVSNFTYLALGSGTITATTGDTQLQTELTDSGLARAASTISTDAANVLQLVHLWEATEVKNVEEVGVLNDASAGVLLARSTFSQIPLQTDDTLMVTYKITVN